MARTKRTPAVTFEGTKFAGRTEDQVKNTLYGQAQQELRNRHHDEFIDIVSDLYSAYGLTYTRRLTDEEKAEQQVRAHLAAYPALAAKFAETGPDAKSEDGPLDGA